MEIKREMHFFTKDEVPGLLKTIRGNAFKPMDFTKSKQVEPIQIEPSDKQITQQSDIQSPEVTNG